ncbi:MAG: DNA modification methylase, partial [Actinobacteria bacterium]|nr:DNA modification methylase [Actinomycetota bacterium]
DLGELESYHERLTESIRRNWTRGFISEMYAPLDDANIQAGERAFFTRRNAEYIDTARQEIEQLPEHLRPYFLAPLLSQASIHVNTAGVFKGFYKDKSGIGCFGGTGKNALSRITRDMEMQLPVFSNFNCSGRVLCGDAGAVVMELPPVDLVYIDPPYNQHPYGSNYFMLNLIASYSRPMRVSSVSGIPETWKRSHYNKRAFAQKTLFSTVENCKASHILISYNSEGFISYDSFVGFLEGLGELEVLETDYNTFRGCRNLRDRDTHVKEYLFLVKRRSPRSGA